MALILYADDEPRYRELVAQMLTQAGHTVVLAADGAEALERAAAEPRLELAILDMLMPGIDGAEACKALKAERGLPVMLLTALGDPAHEVAGLNLGADDYIAKPFRRQVLLARVNALIRRSSSGLSHGMLVAHGPLCVDAAARTATLDGALLALSPREFDLLFWFAGHPGQVFSRDQLLDRVWGVMFDGDPRTVDTHVKSLRAKLGASAELIVTHRGAGYALRSQP